MRAILGVLLLICEIISVPAFATPKTKCSEKLRQATSVTRSSGLSSEDLEEIVTKRIPKDKAVNTYLVVNRDQVVAVQTKLAALLMNDGAMAADADTQSRPRKFSNIDYFLVSLSGEEILKFNGDCQIVGINISSDDLDRYKVKRNDRIPKVGGSLQDLLLLIDANSTFRFTVMLSNSLDQISRRSQNKIKKLIKIIDFGAGKTFLLAEASLDDVKSLVTVPEVTVLGAP